MQIEKIKYDPEEILDKAIAFWMRDGNRPFPSRQDIATHEAHLRNCNGLLASYRILEGGRLRRKAVRA